ncbi:MAG TPA: GNAT family protein [Gemmataceae bacterium]|jgi:ribosomal-protein-alanine N-acetyltransferase
MIDPLWRPPVLETDRLRLRPFEPADAPALFAIARNSNVTRFTTWDAHRTIDDSHIFLTDYVRSRYLEGLPDPYAIELKGDGVLIGAVGGSWASQPNRCMEFGYWLAEPFWGRGLAAEAARALVRHLFAAYPVERVQAHFIEGNAASGRVLEKAGLRFEGVRRHSLLHRGRFWDVHTYAVLRGEWHD